MSASFVSLMYHNVVADDDAGTRAQFADLSPSITGYFVGARRFAQQLDAVKSVAGVMTYDDVREFYTQGGSNCNPQRERGSQSSMDHGPSLTLRVTKSRTENGANPNERDVQRLRVQLTFDDGWRGSVDVAGPLLAERGLQAVLFVTTALVGRPHFLTAAELAHLPRETFHVGSHTVTHPVLNELDSTAIEGELQQSKSELEDIVGYEIDSLSIPNGASDGRVIRIAAECGYRFVCVSSVHRNSVRRGPLSIGRVAIRANTSVETVARYARGNLNRERLRAGVLSVPKRLFGPSRYRQVRRLLLEESPAAQEMGDLLNLCEDGRSRPAAGSPRVVSSGIKP